MLKRRGFWALGGLIGVALVTLCLLLVTTTVANTQTSGEQRVSATLSQTAYNEGERAEVTVMLSGSMVAEDDITVDYELEFPTTDAEGNQRMAADFYDFSGAFRGSVVIARGTTSAQLWVQLVDDDDSRRDRTIGSPPDRYQRSIGWQHNG